MKRKAVVRQVTLGALATGLVPLAGAGAGPVRRRRRPSVSRGSANGAPSAGQPSVKAHPATR